MFWEIPKIDFSDFSPRRVSVKELLEVDLKDVPKYLHEYKEKSLK